MDRLSLPQRIPWRLAWTRRFAAEVHARLWRCFLGGQIRIGAVNLELQALSRVRACISNCAACGVHVRHIDSEFASAACDAQRCSMSARRSHRRGEAEGHSNLWRKSRFVSVRATIVRGSVRLQKAMETFSSSAKINSVRVLGVCLRCDCVQRYFVRCM